MTYYNGPGTVIKKVEFRYDAFDRRIEKRVDDGFGGAVDGVFERNERYWSDGRDLLYITDGNFVPNVSFGQMLTRELPGPAVDQVFADETVVGELLWALSDHQGTARDFADNGGQIMNHLFYNAFGKALTESKANPYWSVLGAGPYPTYRRLREGFTNFVYDLDVQKNFSWTRVYFADIGRWLNPDWGGFAMGDANLYRYVGNSSVNYVDPSGFESRRGLSPAMSLVASMHPTSVLDIDGVPFVLPPDLRERWETLNNRGRWSAFGNYFNPFGEDYDEFMAEARRRARRERIQEGFVNRNRNGRFSPMDYDQRMSDANREKIAMDFARGLRTVDAATTVAGLPGAAKTIGCVVKSGVSTVAKRRLAREAAKTAGTGAESALNGLRLNKSLASTAQMGEAGEVMAGVGARVPFRDAERVAQ